MYLFYIDESGNPDGWQDQDNFVLAGVAIHEGQVRRLSEALDAIQQRFLPGIGVPIEFHAQHIHSGKTERFKKLAPDARAELIDAIYGVIASASFPNLISFATVLHITAVTSGPQVLHDTLEDLCQRFNTFLVRGFKLGVRNKGLMILDRSGRDSRVREAMARFRDSGTRFGYLGNIVDVPYFADSDETRMLQLADFCAYAVGRYYNRGDDRYLSTILPRFDRQTTTGPRVGLKHLTSDSYECSCLACNA